MVAQDLSKLITIIGTIIIPVPTARSAVPVSSEIYDPCEIPDHA